MSFRRPVIAAVALVLAGAAGGCGGELSQTASDELKDRAGKLAFGACKTFASQRQAQRAWELAGRPAAADSDADGKVCETVGVGRRPAARRAPAGDGKALRANCQRTSGVFDLGFSATKYPNIRAHVLRARADGYPSVLVVNREGADSRRDKLLAGVPTKPGHDRDEYPPAFGRSTWKASVMHVPSSENRSHGSVMGVKMRRFCDGTKFRYVFY